MVERLAARWDEHPRAKATAPEEHARWWLNAIADECEDAADLYVGDEWSGFNAAVHLLRTEAER